jgi:hypothetical protein
MESVVHILARCPYWKVFATLTWSGATPPTYGCQRRLLFAHLYRIARIKRIPFRNLLWVVRQERGEKTNRPHYHALIGWAGGDTSNVGQCFAFNSFWNRLPKCGFARHFIYDPGEDAIGYITKGLCGCLSEQGRDALGASHYEASKFGWSGNEVELSAALVRLIGRSIERNHGTTFTAQSEESSAIKLIIAEKSATKTNREFVPESDSIVNRWGNWAARPWPGGRDARHKRGSTPHKNAAVSQDRQG